VWRFADGVCSCCDEVKLCLSTAASKEPTVYPQVTYESGETQWNDIGKEKGKAVPLQAIEALGGRGGIAPTHSRPRH
jgi:hypothetical protein